MCMCLFNIVFFIFILLSIRFTYCVIYDCLVFMLCANLKGALMVQVVSDKKLVKHLQKEVERLEAELRSPEPSSASYLQSLLIEKNLQIEQVHECLEKCKSK